MKARFRVVLVFAALACAMLLSACDSTFKIEGKWKNVSDTSYGQVQPGSIVTFDGKNCNVVSPSDTYAFMKNGEYYRLDCTTMLFSQTLSFEVCVVDNDDIWLTDGSVIFELQRVG